MFNEQASRMRSSQKPLAGRMRSSQKPLAGRRVANSTLSLLRVPAHMSAESPQKSYPKFRNPRTLQVENKNKNVHCLDFHSSLGLVHSKTSWARKTN